MSYDIVLAIGKLILLILEGYIGTNEVQVHLLSILTSAHAPRNHIRILLMNCVQIINQLLLCSRNLKSHLIKDILADVSGMTRILSSSL